MEQDDDIEIAEKQSFNPVDDFNLGLLIYVVKKSLVWVIFIILISVTLSIVYLRYTPRVYQASSTLMLKTEKTTQILGQENLLVEEDPNEISKQVQVMKSYLLIDRVVNSLPLQIGYYKEGKTKFIHSELYTSTPFIVDGVVKDEDIINVPIYLKIIRPGEVFLNFTLGEKDYGYTKDTGQLISSPYFSLKIHFRKNLNVDDLSGTYYFRFLNRGEVMSEIATKLEVPGINLATKTMAIAFKDRNPAKAAAIVSTMANEFIKYDVERKREGVINILEFIKGQIDTFSIEYDQYQDSISSLRIREGYLNKGSEYLSGVSEKLAEYEGKFRDFEYDIFLLNTFKAYLVAHKEYGHLPALTFRITKQNFDDEISHINDLQVQRNLLLLDATPQHPNVRLIDEQIEDLKIKLSDKINNAIDGLKTNLSLLRKEYQTYLYDLQQLPGLQNKFERLDKMAEEKNKFILNLYQQLSNYLIASAGIVSDYVVLEKARIPASPISPRENFVRFGGFAVGLMVGLIFIVVRYLLHNTVISIDDVERKTTAPLLGVIPRYKEEITRSQIVVTKDPKSTITEAFRAVRGNLQFISSSPGPKVISTTSTIPGEGKTFVSINIAAILSLLNKRVIILDFDMRKPRLNKIFDVDLYKGVSTILSGQTTVDDCILDSGTPNLSFITSGPLPPNPSELILQSQLKEMLEYLKTKYDYIILDTPPIGLVTDALELLKLSDYPIYVLRADFSNKSFVYSINRIIRESKIKNLSIVINDYGRGASAYGYSYGQNYAYGYGYGYGYGTQYGGGYYTIETKEKSGWLKKLLQ